MNQKIETHQKDRLTQLDGLRAVAIIFVILGHIDITPLYQSAPVYFIPFLQVLNHSGVTAVSLFMLLSGFLIAYYYPVVKSSVEFLQKRYTRIFPLFISLVITRFFHSLYPGANGFQLILALLLPAVLIHVIWIYGVKKINSTRLSRAIFWAFVSIQLATIAWYTFWIIRHPPNYFKQMMDPWLRDGTIFLVNATLTVPLGNYIGQLDGVYWSLMMEIIFYLLYPFLFVPVAQVLKNQSKTVIVLLMLSTIPLIIGLDKLSYHLLGLYILKVPYFIFFVAGVFLAYIFKTQTFFFNKLSRYFKNSLLSNSTIILFLLTFVGLFYLFQSFPQYSDYIRILSMAPMGVLFLFILAKRSRLAHILSSRVLVFIGSISFSIYLVHMTVIDTIIKYFIPATWFETIIFILIVFVGALALSYMTHWLLERPYFMRSGKVQSVKKVESTPHFALWPSMAMFLLVYFYGVFIAYQSNYNFFSLEHSHPVTDIQLPHVTQGQKTISMDKNPKVMVRIMAKDDNLGIITTSLRYKRAPGISHASQDLVYSIKEVGAKDWYATSHFKPTEVGESKNHPFGFPVIADSKGKKYEIQIALTNTASLEYFEIDLQDDSMRSTYQINKYELVKHPVKLLSLIQNRLSNILENKEAQTAILLVAPFIVMGIFLSHPFKRIIHKTHQRKM